MSSEHFTSIQALGRDNFDTWKLQIRALLVRNGTWKYVSGEKAKPETKAGDDASLAATEAWQDADMKAQSDLVLAIDPSELKHIVGCKTANEVWRKLHTIYEPTKSGRKTTLLKQLLLQKMGEEEDVQEHIRKFFDAVDELCEMEVEINEDLLTIMLLYSLPPSYENFRCTIETLNYIPKPKSVKVKIIDESNQRKTKQSSEMASEVEEMSVPTSTTRESVLKTEETREEAAVNNSGGEQPEEGRLPGRFDRMGIRENPERKFKLAMTAIEDEKQFGNPNVAEIPLEEALSGEDAEDWKRAIQTEFEALIENQTWDLVDRPEEKSVIGCRIALRNKYNVEGILKRRKAQVIANSYLQGSYPCSPEDIFESVRCLMAIAVEKNLIMHHLDVADAFLDSNIESMFTSDPDEDASSEDIFMEVPELFEEMLPRIISKEKLQKTKIGLSGTASKMLQQIHNGNKVCLMKKHVYGLGHVCYQWRNRLTKNFEFFGLEQLSINYCDIYFGKRVSKVLIIILCFDEILLMSNDIVWMSVFKEIFSNCFRVKDLGRVKRFLGMEFNHGDGFLEMSQTGFIEDILRKFGMENSKPAATPLDPEMRWQRSEEWSVDSSDEETGSYPLQELMGRLMNLALGTRPDLMYAVTTLSSVNIPYGEEHWIAAKRILRYLRGTSNLGLKYKKGSMQPECFCTIPSSEVSLSYPGIVLLLANSAVAWSVVKPSKMDLSDTWHEVYRKARTLIRLLDDLVLGKPNRILLYTNNKIQMHKFDWEECKFIKRSAPSIGTWTDIFTKNLALPEHQKCLTQLGMSYIDRKKKNVVDTQAKHCP